MALSPADLGGAEWIALGLGGPSGEEVGPLSWDELLPLIGPARSDTDHCLRRALVYLEALHDLDGAGRQLAMAGNGAWQRWLRFQVAVERSSPVLFERWLEAELQAGQPHPGAVVATFRALLGERERLLDGIPSAPLTPVGRFILIALLGGAQRWEEAARVAAEGTGAARLFAAHVLGDRLGAADKRVELLRELAAEAPLVGAELLLDLACQGAGEEIETALRRRLAALDTTRFPAAAAATAALLRARAGGAAAEPGPALPSLDETQAAAAWRDLVALLEACSSARSADGAAAGADAPQNPTLRDVTRLRAVERLMAAERAEEALRLLEGPAEDRLVAAALRQYRCVCLARLQAWPRLADELLQMAGESEEAPAERALLLTVVALLVLRMENAGAHLSRLAAEAARTAVPGPSLLAAMLLALQRRAGDAAARAAVWSRLFDNAGDPQGSALACFAHGVLQLSAEHTAPAVAALKIDRTMGGDSPLTLGALAVALWRSGRFPELVETLEQLAQSLDGAGRVQLLRRAAAVAVIRAADAAAGHRLMEEVSRLAPDNVGFLEEAAAVALRAGKVDEAATFLERAAVLVDSNARAADLLCAAGTLLQRQGDVDGAEHTFRAAHNLHPLHHGSLQALRVLLTSAGRRRELAPVLRGLLLLADKEPDRGRLLVDLAELHYGLWETEGGTDDADACLSLFDEAGSAAATSERLIVILVTVCDRLCRWDDLIKRLDSRSDSPTALRGLCRAFQGKERWPELATTSWQLAKLSKGLSESLDAALRAGETYHKRLSALDQAEECYVWASQRFHHVEALRRLVDIHRERGDQAKLAAGLEELLSATPPGPARSPVALELGQLYGGPLAQPKAAVRHFEAVLERDPANDEALGALEKVFEGERALNDLARVLERRLQRAEAEPEKLRVLLKLGWVFGELKDPASLLRIAQRAHSQFVDHAEAVAFAEKTYREQRRFAELCDLYERRIQALEPRRDGAGEIVELLQRKGRVELEDLGQSADAVNSLARALERRPDDSATLATVERVLSETGDWQRLLAIFEKRANGLTSRADQVASLHRAAAIATQQLQDEAETTRLYERIHALDPSDAASFTFLARKLERKNDYKQLVKLLVGRAARVRSVGEKVGCLLQAAAVCETTDLPSAVKIYRRTLAVDPNCMPAMSALARIYESTESWKEFLEITDLQILRETKREAKALLHFKRGSVLETKYLNEDDAIRHYRQALKTHHGCVPALHSLRDLYSRREDWRAVVETLEWEARLWHEKKDRADVLSQIAEIYATRLGDQAQAFRYYKLALETFPENMRAALAFFDALTANGSYGEAARWGAVYARQVEARGSQVEQAEFHARFGDVLRRVGRYDEAAKYLVWALEARPGETGALFSLLDLCHESPDSYDFEKAFGDLLSSYSKRDDPTANAVLLASCGALAERRGDVSGALDLYRQAASAAGSQIRLVRPLADLLVRLGEPDEARSLIEHAMPAASGEAFNDWLDAVFWLVEFEMIWKGNYRRAEELCREALQQQPNRDDVRLLLANAQLLLKEASAAQAVYQRVCENLEHKAIDPPLLARRYHSLAIAARQAGNGQLAESSWRRARELAPDWPYPRLALVRSNRRRGDELAADRELAGARENGMEAHPDVLRAEAEIQARRGRADRAVELYRKLTAAPEADASDRVQLARHLLRAGSADEAIAVLKQTISEAGDFLPAVEELAAICAATGALPLANRASQVASLFLPQNAQFERPPPLRRPLRQEFWTRVLEPLNHHPLDELWRAVSRAFMVRQPPPAVAGTPVTSTEVHVALSQTVALFEMRLDALVVPVPGFAVALHEQQLLMSTEVERLRVHELRVLVASVLTEIKAGYGLLVGRPPEVRTELGLQLTGLLVDPGSASSQLLLQSLSRREQRQAALAARAVGSNKPEELVRSWLTTLESLAIRVALLITDDIAGLARVRAAEARIPLECLDETGPRALLPELGTIIDFYLSDEFDRTRAALQA